jgi:hypothetical protein
VVNTTIKSNTKGSYQRPWHCINACHEPPYWSSRTSWRIPECILKLRLVILGIYCTRKFNKYNFSQHSSSWKATSSSASEEIHSILCNLTVHYHAHKSPPLVRILNQLNPIHALPLHLRSTFTLSYQRLTFQVVVCLSLSHQNNVRRAISLLTHACYMRHPSHPPWSDHPSIFWWGLWIMKLLIM